MEQPTELDIDCSDITEEEIIISIRKLRNNKTAGSDKIKAEIILKKI